MTIRFLNPSETAYVRDSINSDREFRLASRFFSKDILLIVGDAKCIVKLRDGNVTEIKLNPTFMNPWSFFIKGSSRNLAEVLATYSTAILYRPVRLHITPDISSSAAILKPPLPTTGR